MSSLIFIEEPHKYYLIDLELEETNFDTEACFIKEHGELAQYNPQELISATTILGRYDEHFDADAVIDRMFSKTFTTVEGKEIYTGSNPEYQGMSKEEVKWLWDLKRNRACDYGTFVHLGAENYCNHGKFLFPLRPEFRQVKNFFDNSGFECETPELRLYSKKYAIAGTVDLLLVDDEGRYWIGDWKTNHGKDLKDKVGFGKKMLFPLSHIGDTPYWHYALQFSLYRYILETEYDFEGKFEGQFALHLKREGTQCEKIDMPYLKDEIEAILHQRALELKMKQNGTINS